MLGDRGLRQAKLVDQVDDPSLTGGEPPHDRQPGRIAEGAEQRGGRRKLNPPSSHFGSYHRHMTMIDAKCDRTSQLLISDSQFERSLGFARDWLTTARYRQA